MRDKSIGWMAAGFGGLGLLIGNLVGLTSESLVGRIISLLFVFIGGSLLAFLRKLDVHDRKTAGASLLALSLASIVGVYMGILMTEYRWLSPANGKAVEESKYLRNGGISRAAAIDATKDPKNLEGAYQRMYELALEYEKAIGRGK